MAAAQQSMINDFRTGRVTMDKLQKVCTQLHYKQFQRVLSQSSALYLLTERVVPSSKKTQMIYFTEPKIFYLQFNHQSGISCTPAGLWTGLNILGRFFLYDSHQLQMALCAQIKIKYI